MPTPLAQSAITRRASLALAAGVAALPTLAAASAPRREIEVPHAKGMARVMQTPRTPVVFDLATLDAMHALQLPVAGVARAGLPPYLQAFSDARKYPVAGTLFEPDFEALSRLRPDLILVGGRSAARLDTLSRIAPTLDMSTRSTHLLQDMDRNVSTLGALFGKQSMAEQLMALVNREIETLKPLAQQAGPGLLVLAINDKLNVQAPGSRFGLLHDVLGVPPALAAGQSPQRGQSFTMEDIARIDPEWLYVIDRNAATGSAPGGAEMIPSQKVFDNPTIRATKAGRNGKVLFLDPKGWYLLGSAGPIAMINNVRQIRTALG